MPSSGSSARIASRKPIWGASLARRARSLPCRSIISSRRDGRARLCAVERVDQAAQDRLGVADERDRGRRKRSGSSGSASIRIDRERVVDAPLVERPVNSRVPIPSTTSASRPQLMAERQRHAEWIAAVEHAAAAPEGHHRRLQQSDSSATSAAASCAPPPATISGAAAAPRRLAAASDRILVDRQGRWRRGAAIAGTGAAAAPDVDGAFERRRPGPAAAHGSDGGGDQAGRLGRRADAGAEIDEPRNDAGLVADLVQMAIAAADRGLRDLADQRQHRRVGAVGGEERGRRVEQARPRHHRRRPAACRSRARRRAPYRPRPAHAGCGRCGCGRRP